MRPSRHRTETYQVGNSTLEPIGDIDHSHLGGNPIRRADTITNELYAFS